tara:strand:- start:26 stop:238 length:213 start_codon:yes stop_codon:yes gene_type:complete
MKENKMKENKIECAQNVVYSEMTISGAKEDLMFILNNINIEHSKKISDTEIIDKCEHGTSLNYDVCEEII